MNALIPPQDTPLATDTQALAIIPEASLWLANFTSPQTRRTYRVAVSEFLQFHQLSHPSDLETITAAHLIVWRDALMQAGAKPRTVNNRLSALSSLFNHLCNQQVTRINPVMGLKRPRVNQDRVETPIITKAQVRRLLDAPNLGALKGVRDSAILHVLFFCGCRASEVTTLKRSDYFEDGGYSVLDFTVKGGKKNRLAIHPEAKNALDRYLALAPHGQEKAAYVFQRTQAPNGRKLSYNTIEQLFRHYASAVGLPDSVTLHSARATFITEALTNNCLLEDVQASVAHADISTTQMYDKRPRGYKESASFKVHF